MNANQFLPEHDTVLEISTLAEYTEEEILNCWYSKPEFEKIANRSYKQALRWESGESSMPDSFHRGLEILTKEGEDIITSSVERCIDAVMDEQAAQWEEDADDFDRIAAVSEEVSRFSAAWALEQAITDEQEAQRMCKRMVTTNKSKDSKLDSSDHTSICSDLSHPESDSGRSRESSSETRESKKGTKPIFRRVKALRMPKLPCRTAY